MNIVITGGNRGIGLELIKKLLNGGHQVTAWVRDPSKANELKKLSGALKLVEVDLTQFENIEHAAQKTEGPVDVLINNAGIYQKKGDGRLLELDPKVVAQTLEVNLLAPITVTKALYTKLKASKQARVANISSLMGSITDNTSGGSEAYRISKAALNMFSKSLAIEEKNWIVLALHPGWVQTDMGGPQAPVMPNESAEGLAKIILSAKFEDSGRFFDYRGRELPW